VTTWGRDEALTRHESENDMTSADTARSGYPALSPEATDRLVEVTELIARERLGVQTWNDADRDELRVTTGSLLAAAETLHSFPLANADEPAFSLRLA
jgi:hypothetical protein